MKNRLTLFTLPLLAVGFLLCSCQSTGPKNIVRDRSAYINAISDSWKNQLLLNIVKLRYADAPVFLEISNVVNSYELRGQVNAGMGFESKGSGFMPFLGTEASFSDKPTVSYTPMSGQKFATSLMNPISINMVMGLVYTGYPADMIFPITINSVNGIKNGSSGATKIAERSPEFERLTLLFRKLSKHQLLTLNMSGDQEIIVNFNPENVSDPSIRNEATEFAKLLGISLRNKNYTIKYGSVPPDSGTIVMKPRSLLDILTEMGNYVQVPEEHLLAGQTSPPAENFNTGKPGSENFLDIKSSEAEPVSAFFSVKYNNYWFYIDKTDFQSKRVFSYLILLSALSDVSTQKSGPILTIPAN